MHSGRAALGMGGGSGGPLTNETRALACGPAGILHFPRRTAPPQKKNAFGPGVARPPTSPQPTGERQPAALPGHTPPRPGARPPPRPSVT